VRARILPKVAPPSKRKFNKSDAQHAHAIHSFSTAGFFPLVLKNLLLSEFNLPLRCALLCANVSVLEFSAFVHQLAIAPILVLRYSLERSNVVVTVRGLSRENYLSRRRINRQNSLTALRRASAAAGMSAGPL
jgi:hypothetical protein